MGTSPETLVTEFHSKYDLSVDLTNSEILEKGELILRENLIREEYKEVQEAIAALRNAMYKGEKDSINELHSNVLKELCDLVYVVVGTAVSWDYDFETAFDRVHDSNMSKDGGVNAGGKMTKGPSYIEADMSNCVRTVNDKYDLY